MRATGTQLRGDHNEMTAGPLGTSQTLVEDTATELTRGTKQFG
jgi:hypothetical protein